MENVLNQRIDKYYEKLKETYFKVYGNLGATTKDFEDLLEVIKKSYNNRSNELHELDLRDPKWYMSKDLVGMMVYVDLFAGDLLKMIDYIPYYQELGITYLHLMPLLKPRVGENDGGYAVEDYKDIDPNLGTKDDFIALTKAYRDAGIDICIDYVLNHTADTHEWAKRALLGEKYYMDLYEMYDDRSVPDLYDATVPEVLPDKCPGNFTYKEEINKWVYTSFSSFQWDLNFKNPEVFKLMVETLLYLANEGVNMIRLDAIPFMWKEVGTSCRNLKPVHDLIYMFNIIKDMACPSLALLGEAIVEPDEIVKYFGTEEHMECGILYNANYMVNIWNALAMRDSRLLRIDNSKYKIPSSGCWMNYARCHDDIGWGFNEDAIQNMGFNPFEHKQFLINFYSNNFNESFAKGEIYQFNPNTMDARTNGTLASLAGLDMAIEDCDEFERIDSLRRINLIHSLIMSHQGIPLIYSGDEIATLNDHSYLNDAHKKEEGRWVHRPYFNHERANLRNNPTTNEAIVFNALQQMINIRKEHQVFNGDVPINVIDLTSKEVYMFEKNINEERVVFVYNLSEHNQYICTKSLHYLGKGKDLIQGKSIDFNKETIRLHPYEFMWIKI